MPSPDHTIDIPVTFGDCDPAGIVFYPNYFRWFDRCFHDFLQQRGGGHRALCDRLGSAGFGLMDVGAIFRAPVKENQPIRLEMRIDHWAARSLRLAYTGYRDGVICVEGHELRGVFMMADGRMTAGATGPLRAALGL